MLFSTVHYAVSDLFLKSLFTLDIELNNNH